MREMEASQPTTDEIATASLNPWLTFAVHHGERTPREGILQKSGLAGLVLDAEASLRGSLAVLVGPSGAGKTSLLRSIAEIGRASCRERV